MVRGVDLHGLANPRTRARIEAAVLELLADAPAVKPD
jgi:hypothetical protein